MINTNTSGTIKRLVEGVESDSFKGIKFLYRFNSPNASTISYFTISLPKPLLDMKAIVTVGYGKSNYDTSGHNANINIIPVDGWDSNMRTAAKIQTIPSNFNLPSGSKGFMVDRPPLEGMNFYNRMYYYEPNTNILYVASNAYSSTNLAWIKYYAIY